MKTKVANTKSPSRSQVIADLQSCIRDGSLNERSLFGCIRELSDTLFNGLSLRVFQEFTSKIGFEYCKECGNDEAQGGIIYQELCNDCRNDREAQEVRGFSWE